MKIDYNKDDFTQNEIEFMKSEYNKLKQNDEYDHLVPLIIIINSKILKMDKRKFLIADDIKFNDFVNNTLRKKLLNLQKDDSLVLKIKIYADSPNKNIKIQHDNNETLRQVYNTLHDPATGFLIIQVSRLTTYKWSKKIISSLLYW